MHLLIPISINATNSAKEELSLLLAIFSFFLPGGIDNIEIDMEKQRVYVTSALSSDELLETIKKAGKTCSYVGTG